MQIQQYHIRLQAGSRGLCQALGTWQGIYPGEHRDHASSRALICTIWGE